MVQLIKPSAKTLADRNEALRLNVRVFEAIAEIQRMLNLPTPASIAATDGLKNGEVRAVKIVKITGATVTDPETGKTFVADVYLDGFKL
jgi:hypothetical protein